MIIPNFFGKEKINKWKFLGISFDWRDLLFTIVFFILEILISLVLPKIIYIIVIFNVIWVSIYIWMIWSYKGTKNYIFFIKKIRFKIRKKIYSHDDGTDPQFYRYSKENYIVTKNNIILKFYKLSEMNIDIFNENDKKKFIDVFSNSLRMINIPFDLMCDSLSDKFDEQKEWIEKKLAKNISNEIEFGLIHEFQKIEVIENTHNPSKKWILVLKSKNNDDIVTVENKLNMSFTKLGIKLIELNKNQFMPLLKNRIHDLTEFDFTKLNETINDYLKINNIQIGADFVKIDNSYTSFLSITKLPYDIPIFWLINFKSEKFNSKISIEQVNKFEAKILLNKAENRIKYNLNDKKVTSEEQIIYSKAFDDLIKLRENVHLEDEKILKLNMVIAVHSASITDLIDKVKLVKAELIGEGYEIDEMKYLQDEGFKMFICDGQTLTTKYDKYSIFLDTRSVGYGYPLISTSWTDKEGYLMNVSADAISNISGEESIESLMGGSKEIFFNPFYLGGFVSGRTNSNLAIFANTGHGKTIAMSLLIKYYALKNIKTYILDIEEDYINIAKFFNGQVLDMSNAKGNMINILEPFSIEIEEIQKHIIFLIDFFKLIFDDWEESLSSILVKSLDALYRETDLTKEIPTLYDLLIFVKSTQEVITLNLKINDLKDKLYFSNINEKLVKEEISIQQEKINLISKKYMSKKDINDMLLFKESDINKFITIIEECQNGRLKNWNGKTNVNLNNNIIIFNLHKIDSDKMLQAQEFVIMNFLYKKMKNIKKQNDKINNEFDFSEKLMKATKFSVIIDEAHKLINEKNSIVLDEITNMVKRMRKYYGQLCIATQNLSDFSKGGRTTFNKLQGIISQMSYVFLGQLGQKDIEIAGELWGKSYSVEGKNILEKQEEEYLKNCQPGQFLMKIGTNIKIMTSFAVDTSDMIMLQNIKEVL